MTMILGLIYTLVAVTIIAVVLRWMQARAHADGGEPTVACPTRREAPTRPYNWAVDDGALADFWRPAG